MTDIAQDLPGTVAKRRTPSRYQSDEFKARLKARYNAERRFQVYGALAIATAAAMLVILLFSICSKGYLAFWQTEIKLEITFDPAVLDPSGERDPNGLRRANYQGLINSALYEAFPEVSGRRDRRNLRALISSGGRFQLADMVVANPDLIGTTQEVWFLASDDIDQFAKGTLPCGVTHEERMAGIPCTVPEDSRPINDRNIGWYDQLYANGQVDFAFNSVLFTKGNSREPELAGMWGAIVGSFYTLVITLALAVPIGVAAAVYLEEFAPKNAWTDLIEININNLAAVPSIVFGLLGLAVFLNFFGLPRSAPLVGGIVLALMTLPTVIIATRAALKAVPPSIREAALGVGASPYQVILHHVLPLAAPGILTGTIIGMAQALGETAPLLMVGMVAFIVDIPQGITDAATVMPVQIYMWSDLPERAFVERTSAAIMVLLGFLILMNGLAVYLRKKFERRW